MTSSSGGSASGSSRANRFVAVGLLLTEEERNYVIDQLYRYGQADRIVKESFSKRYQPMISTGPTGGVCPYCGK